MKKSKSQKQIQWEENLPEKKGGNENNQSQVNTGNEEIVESDVEEISKEEVGAKRSRRRWTQRPGDDLKLRQTFNKRRKGLVSKAYQLSYLTQVKVFLYMVNEDKGEGWIYASPNFESSLNNQVVQMLKKLAGLRPEAPTEILRDSQQPQQTFQTSSLNLDVKSSSLQASLKHIPDNLDAISDFTALGNGTIVNQPNTINLQTVQMEKQQERDKFEENVQNYNRSCNDVDIFLKTVFSNFPAKPAIDTSGFDLIRPRNRQPRFDINIYNNNNSTINNISANVVTEQAYGIMQQNNTQSANFVTLSDFPQKNNLQIFATQFGQI